MAIKKKGFTQEDLEAKGFVKNEQGFYSKPSYPIKPDVETGHVKKVRKVAQPLKHEVPGSNYRGKKLDMNKPNIPTRWYGGHIATGRILFIKPLSVNEAWQGKRFKTDKYKIYERIVLNLLPEIQIPNAPYHLSLIFGVSSPLADFDNPVKPFVDILQKKYGFNDRDIMKATIEKVLVNKTEEFITWTITNHNPKNP